MIHCQWIILRFLLFIIHFLSLTMFVLPYSTCSVFLSNQRYKSSSRNRFQTENLEAALLAKEYFKDNSLKLPMKCWRNMMRCGLYNKKTSQLVPKSLSESQEAEKLWPKQRKFCNWKAKKNSFKKKEWNLSNNELNFLNKKIHTK